MLAKPTKQALIFLCLLIIAIILTASQPASALGRRVGGRREVKNVGSNREVQYLGRYCVDQYNLKIRREANGSDQLLVFEEVVAAETQVVAGIKYYLRIAAAAARGGGAARDFEAVVVVRPWTRSKELLRFDPSTTPYY